MKAGDDDDDDGEKGEKGMLFPDADADVDAVG
jgi:hypothetical protein